MGCTVSRGYRGCRGVQFRWMNLVHMGAKECRGVKGTNLHYTNKCTGVQRMQTGYRGAEGAGVYKGAQGAERCTGYIECRRGEGIDEQSVQRVQRGS